MSDAPSSSCHYSVRLIQSPRGPSLAGPKLATTGFIAALLMLTGCGEMRTISLTAPAANASCPAEAAVPVSRVSALDPTGLVQKASDEASAAISNKDPVALLKASLQSVRYETTFVHIAKPAFEKYTVVIDEAATLVRKDRALVIAKKNNTPVDVSDGADPVEAELINDLPDWAGQASTFLPVTILTQLRENGSSELKNIVDNTATILDLTTRYSSEKSSLIPHKTAAQPTSAPDGATWSILASINPLEHHQLLDSLETLAGYRAFHVLTLLSAAHIHEMLTKAELPNLDSLNAEVRIFNVNRFLSTYFDAYFRGGQFIQFTADQKSIADTLSTDLQRRVKSGLQTSDTARVSQFLQGEFTQLCKGSNNSSICATTLGQTAFVTRSGISVQFSGISYDVTTKDGLGLSHNYPQLSQFGPQLIRVLVEAVFDSNGLSAKGLPNSTACQENLFPGTDCLTTGDPQQASLQQVDQIASSFEALNSMATGILIRGLNEAALNNEAVSQSIETLIGVISRKIAERVLYAASVQTTCPVPLPKLKVQATTTTSFATR